MIGAQANLRFERAAKVVVRSVFGVMARGWLVKTPA
jgi:hypothetical protein